MMQHVKRYSVEALVVLALRVEEALGRVTEQVAILNDAHARCDPLEDASLARWDRFFGQEMEWLAARERYLTSCSEGASSRSERRRIRRLLDDLEQLRAVLTAGERLVDAMTERNSKRWCVARKSSDH
ncbi:hypothetical protein LZC95_05235 [Pendulispora brunnea]|uniref:Flagellar protein FlgN n=1 Tax=Pendulispora brunnea TaxID=2905690 RepID=A0ABZ2KC27_9BACT